MGIVVRQSILTSIISYAGIVIGYINLLYLYPKFLQKEQLGLLRAIQDGAMLMAPFATLGLAQGILRFFPQYIHSEKDTRRFVSLIVVLGIFSFTIFLIVFNIFEAQLLGFFEQNASILVRYKNVALALTLALVFMTIFEQFAKSIMQIALPNFLREVGIRFLQALLVIAFFYSLLSFQQFIVGSVVVYFISLAVLLFFLLRLTIGFDFTAVKTFSWSKIREILAFSSLSFVSVSAMILIGKMDSLMVTGFLGLSSVAVYSTAYYMATVIEIPKRAITQTTTTLIARAFERNDLIEVQNLYRKTAINQLIIGALLLIGIWANLDNIFKLMPNGHEYSAGAVVVVLIGLGKLLDMAFGPSSEIIGLSKYYWFNLVCVTTLAVIVVIANYFFIPRFGINGAAYGAVAALVIYNLVKFIFILLMLRMQPFTLACLKVAAITATTALLNYFLPHAENVFADIAYRSALITLVYGSLILMSHSSEEINKAFWTGFRYLGARIKRQDH